MDNSANEDWQRQQLFKRREAARIFGVNVATVYRRIRQGHIKVVNTAIGERISRDEIRRVLSGDRPVLDRRTRTAKEEAKRRLFGATAPTD